MKPFRGKRTELGEFVAAIQPAPHAGARCTWRRRSATTVRPGRQKPGGKVATRSRVVLQAAAASADLAGEERLRCTRASERPDAVGLRRPVTNCSQFDAAPSACRAARCRAAPRVRVAWFPALRPTRLETRTKELSTRASRWARRTPVAQLRQNGRDPALACRRNAGPRPTRCKWPRRKSACAQTRKVVNYA